MRIPVHAGVGQGGYDPVTASNYRMNIINNIINNLYNYYEVLIHE